MLIIYQVLLHLTVRSTVYLAFLLIHIHLRMVTVACILQSLPIYCDGNDLLNLRAASGVLSTVTLFLKPLPMQSCRMQAEQFILAYPFSIHNRSVARLTFDP